jgi:stage V sporulation protein B
MTLLYGENTALAGGIILSIFGFATATAGLSMALATVLQGIGKQNTVFINFAVGLILKLIFNIVFISMPSINIFGSALSTVVCFLYIIISLIVILKKSGFMPPLKNVILKPFFAALICGITALLICSFSDNKLVTIIAIFTSGVVYFIALLILKPFDKADFIDLPMGEKLIKVLKLPENS